MKTQETEAPERLHDETNISTRVPRRWTATALTAVVAVAGLVGPGASPAHAAPTPYGPSPVLLAGARADAEDGPPDSSSAALGNRLLFSAAGQGDGYEPWVTDGTPAGTRLLRNVGSGTGVESRPSNFVTFKGRVWFSAYSPAHGREWWVSDGTGAGTRLFADLVPGGDDSDPANPVVVGERMFFRAHSPGGGYELWVTDGSVGGTRQVKDIAPGPESSFPSEITRLGSKVVFRAAILGGARKAWVSDGSAAGTRRLDLTDDGADLQPREFVTVGDRTFFVARTPDTGRELWATRGVPGDARLVREIVPGPGGGNVHYLTRVGSRLFFAAFHPDSGLGLWSSNGEPGGTQLVRDILPLGSFSLGSFRAVGSTLFFAADDGAHGVELWRSDGSAGGTRMVRDLLPGADGSYPEPFAAIDGKLVFEALTASGREPWITNGTATGTRQLADIAPGAAESGPYEVGVVGKTAIFGAEDDRGYRIYAHTVPTSTALAAPRSNYSRRTARLKRIVVPVRVTSTSSLSGAVTIVYSGRVVSRGSLRSGRANLRIVRALPPGRHVLRVNYAGSVGAQRSTATFVIRVRR